MQGWAKLWVEIRVAGMPCTMSGQSSTGGPDIYDLEVIRTALKFQSKGFVLSVTQKHLGRLGDRVSIGPLKILDE
jgi:hypothetical protein